MDSIRICHNVYGPGEFIRLLPEIGHARCAFDIDGGVQRRVRTRDYRPETLADIVSATSIEILPPGRDFHD